MLLCGGVAEVVVVEDRGRGSRRPSDDECESANAIRRQGNTTAGGQSRA